MPDKNNFKPYCVFIDPKGLLGVLKNKQKNSVLIIEMPLITELNIYLQINKALKKNIYDLKLLGRLDRYILITDLVVRKYDDHFSINYGGGRFHQDINFYRTLKALSVWILLQGNKNSQRLEFILDQDLEFKLDTDNGVEINDFITNGRDLIKLPPPSLTINNCVIFSGLTPHRPSGGRGRVSIDFRINSFPKLFDLTIFLFKYLYNKLIIKLKSAIKYILFG
jgi:hypothetical protein